MTILNSKVAKPLDFFAPMTLVFLSIRFTWMKCLVQLIGNILITSTLGQLIQILTYLAFIPYKPISGTLIKIIQIIGLKTRS
jgi:hypothetical protein